MSDLPPDYESPYTSSGLVKELSDTMKYGIPTHPDWPENLACSLISMMMGKGRYLENKLGKLYANFMSIDIGASGLSFKTVPLKKWMRPILEELTSIFNP